MNLLVIASSGFNNQVKFEEEVNKFEADAYIVKKKSKPAEWLKDKTIITFDKYNDLEVTPETKILAFWDGESLNVKKIVEAFPNQTTVISYENTTTKSFMDEIEKIKNEKWKLGCKELVKKLPNYFWVVAASSSGKYHPKCDLGSGGLVRHSVMVCEYAIEWVRSELFIEENDVNMDMAIIAALFHDCLKQGNECNGHTVFDHPILAAEFMAKELKNYIEEPYLSTICDGVRTHMGKWTTSTYAPDVILEKPSTEFQKLIHAADYAASRKTVSGLEEWNL